MTGQQHLRQCHSTPLTATEPANVSVEIHIRQQLLDHFAGVRLGGPHVIRPASDDDLADQGVRPEVIGLPQIPHRQPGDMGDPARIGLASARQDAQQRRLAVTVSADDPDRVTVVDAQADRVEQGTGAVADGRALDVDHVCHQPPMIGRRAVP